MIDERIGPNVAEYFIARVRHVEVIHVAHVVNTACEQMHERARLDIDGLDHMLTYALIELEQQHYERSHYGEGVTQ